MPPKDLQSLPFLTRDMLAFQESAVLGLLVQSRGVSDSDITITGATREGPFSLRHSIGSTGAFTSESFRLPDVPIWLSVIDIDESSGPGLSFVSVSLTVNGNVIHNLMSGYVYQDHALTWPATATEHSQHNRGLISSADSADPAVGVELSITVPTRQSWRIVSARFVFVTSAAVTNRNPHIVIQQAGSKAIEAFSDKPQTAGQTIQYTVESPGYGANLQEGNDIIIPIPKDIVIIAGDTVTTETTNIQGNDNFGVMTLFFERLLIGQ